MAYSTYRNIGKAALAYAATSLSIAVLLSLFEMPEWLLIVGALGPGLVVWGLLWRADIRQRRKLSANGPR